ncbi:MAG: hypothetical protein ACI9S8_001497 [Chlamydiales bacterium]
MTIPDEFRDAMQIISSCSLPETSKQGGASEALVIKKIDAILNKSEDSGFWEGLGTSDIESLKGKVAFFKKRIISLGEVSNKLQSLEEKLNFQEKVKIQEEEIPKALERGDLSRFFPVNLNDTESSQAAEALVSAAKKMDRLGSEGIKTLASQLNRLNIKSETARFQIVEKILKSCPEMTRAVGDNIRHADIQTVAHRKKLGQMIAKHNVHDFKVSAPQLGFSRDDPEFNEIVSTALEDKPQDLVFEMERLDIQDPAERLRLARCVLEKDPALLPQHFKKFKIENSSDRQAIALELIGKGHNPSIKVMTHFENFELDDPEVNTPIAHAALKADMFSFAKHFQKLKIRDETSKEQLIKMLMKKESAFSSEHISYRNGLSTFFSNAANFFPKESPISEDHLRGFLQNHPLQLVDCIDNFPGIPPDTFRSCMRILIEKCPASVCQNYDKFMIKGALDQSTCLEDAKRLAEDSPNGVAENFNKFGTFTSSKRFELAQFIAAQDGDSAILSLENFNLNLEQKIEVFKIAARTSGGTAAEFISKLDIPHDYNPLDIPGEMGAREEVFVSIALECVKSDAGGFLKHLENFTGKSPSSNGDSKIQGLDTWINISNIAAQNDGAALGKYLKEIPIDWDDNDELKLSLAKKAANSRLPVAEYIANFDLPEDKRYEIAKIVAEKTVGDQNSSPLATHISCFAIGDERKRRELALIAAQHSGRSVAKNLDKFEITTPDVRMQILKAAARENGYYVQDNYEDSALTEHLSGRNLELAQAVEIFANAQVGMMNTSSCFDEILPMPAENLATYPGLRLMKYPRRIAKDPGELTGSESQKEIDKLKRDFDGKILKQLGSPGGVLHDLYSKTVREKNDPQVTKWFGYVAAHTQTRGIASEKLEVTKQALECIAGLRIPKMRYNLTDLLLKYVYDESDSDIFESMKAIFQEESKDLDEKDAPLFYMLLLPMFDAQNALEGMDEDTKAIEEKEAFKDYLNMIKDLLTSKQFAKDPSKSTILKSLQTVVTTTQLDEKTKRDILKEIFPIVADRDSSKSQVGELHKDLKLIAEIIDLGHGDMLLHKRKPKRKKITRTASRAWEDDSLANPQDQKSLRPVPPKKGPSPFAQEMARQRHAKELAGPEASPKKRKIKAPVPLFSNPPSKEPSRFPTLTRQNLQSLGPTIPPIRGKGVLSYNDDDLSTISPTSKLSRLDLIPIEGSSSLPFSDSELSPLTASTTASDLSKYPNLGPSPSLHVEEDEEESLLSLSKEILQDALSDDLGIRGVDDLLGKFSSAFSSPRLEGAVMAYLATLKSHTPGPVKEKAIDLYQTSIKFEMEGRHQELRYESTAPLQKEHIDKLFENNPERLEKWKAGETITLQDGLKEASGDNLELSEAMQELPACIDQTQYPLLFESYSDPGYNRQDQEMDLNELTNHQKPVDASRAGILELKDMAAGLQKRPKGGPLQRSKISNFNAKFNTLYKNLVNSHRRFPGKISFEDIEFFKDLKLTGTQNKESFAKDLLKKLNPLLGQLNQASTTVAFQKGMLEFKFADASDKAQVFQDSVSLHIPKFKKKDPQLHAALEKIQKTLASDQKYDGWTIADTDTWEDMLLCGTEVSSSCQNIRSDSYRSICLLSYLTDGKNRAVTIKDKSGKIVARRILRFLWDTEHDKPVLFMEKLYPTPGVTPKMEAALEAMCCRRAKHLGVSLVTRSPPEEGLPSFDGELHSYGSGAPKEYVDGSSGSGGMRPNGIYTLTKNPAEYGLLYSSEENPQEAG